MKIGYIISRFPSVFQPWIAQELLATYESGFDIKIFSLKKPAYKIDHQAAKLLLDKIYYTPLILSFPVIYSTFILLMTNPMLFFHCVFTTIKGYYKDKRNLIKSIAILPKTFHYALIIKNSGITHIHAHWATIPALSALLISKISNIPFSITCHAIDIFDETTMLEAKIKAAKFIVTCTQYNKSHLTETYPTIDSKKIHVNYHGKDLSKVRRRGRNNSNHINVLSVGRLSESKGYRYLLEAMRDLRHKHDLDVRCLIIGDGPSRKMIEDMVIEYGLENAVTLTGALSHEEVLDYYDKADIFVLAMVANPDVGYPHRGIPNVIAEAMAMEIPVITTKMPAIDELVEDGKNGILVEEKNSQAICEAIKQLSASKEARERMGSKGRETVEKLFDINTTIVELVKVFRNYVRN